MMKKILCLVLSLALSVMLLTGCLFLLNPDNYKSGSESSHTAADEETDPSKDVTEVTGESQSSAPQA